MSKRFLKFLPILNLLTILSLSASPFAFPQKALAAASDNYRWVAHNDGISGASISWVIVDPNTPTTVYAFAGNLGVYKSTNSGSNWTRKSTGLPSINPTSTRHGVAIDQNDSNIIYAVIKGKVYKTTDGAENWTESSSGTSFPSCGSPDQIASILLDPQNSTHLFASTITAGCNGGIFESNDSGANWTQIAGNNISGSGLGNDGGHQLAIDPTDDQKLYTATIYITFLYSTNGGHTWTKVVPIGAGEHSYSVAVDPSSTNRIFLGNENGLFLSTDYGLTWTSLASQSGTYVYDIKFAPSNSSIVYMVAGGDLLKSTDGGLNWSSLSHTAKAPSQLSIHPTDSNTIYVASTGKGVYKSTNGGSALTQINTGIPATSYASYVIPDPDNENILYGAVSGSGVYQSSDKGSSWQLVGSIGSLLDFQVSPTNSDIMYYCYYDFYKSSDGGQNWSLVYDTPSGYIRSFAIDPQDNNILWFGNATTKQILKSTDGGDNWSVITTLSGAGDGIWSIKVDPQNSNRLYAATYNYPWRSEDGGQTWTQLTSGLSKTYANYGRYMAIDPDDPSIVYYATQWGGLYKSTNYGNSWVEITPSGLVNPTFDEITVSPFDSNTLFVSGIQTSLKRYYTWKSTDGGSSWEEVGNSVWGTRITLDINNTGRLFGGKYYYNGSTGYSNTYFYENYIPVFSTSTISVADGNGGQVVPGDTLTYTVTVTNSGWADGNDTTLTATIPSGLTYVANSTTRDGSTVSPDPVSSGTLSLSIGNLSKDDSIEVTYQVTVDSNVIYNSTISHSGTITSDEDTAGTSTGSASVTIGDETAPSSGTISINSGDSYTTEQTVTLNISATDVLSGVSQMVVSENSDFTGAAWETYSTTREYVFSPENGTRTVYIKFRDEAGNESDTYSDSIVFDDTDPALFELDSPTDGAYTNSERPTFKWKAASTPDATAGLSEYKLWVDNGDSGDFTVGDIPPAQNIDLENNKYRVRYEGFDDSNDDNNYVSVYTKSSSEWGSLDFQNDGQLKEGKRTWTVTAIDHAGNERSISRTVYVELSHPTPTPIPTPTPSLTLITSLPVSSTSPAEKLETEIVEEIIEEEGQPTYIVKLKVVDAQSNPVEGAKVTLASEPKEAVTDEKGLAIFEDVEPGEHKITVAYKGQTGEQQVNLEGYVKEFLFTIQIRQTNPFASLPVIFVISVFALLVVLLLFLLFRRRA